MISVTPIYAALCALIFVFLSVRVIQHRRDHSVSLGDGDDKVLLRRIRGHANCAEYAPIGVILLLLAELQGMAPLWLHLLGAMLVLGRGLHAWAFSADRPNVPGRVGGMVLTFLMLIFASLGLLAGALFG